MKSTGFLRSALVGMIALTSIAIGVLLAPVALAVSTVFVAIGVPAVLVVTLLAVALLVLFAGPMIAGSRSWRRMRSAFVGLFTLGGLLALTGCGAYQLTETEALRANKAANAYASAVGGKLVSVSGQDSEPDGYVSGEVTMADGTTRAIRCSYRSAEAGCTAKTGARSL